ncbi:hypothetical protein E0H22_04525 [Rhodopseudomonas boonkerdii]|uniref:glucosamine inositolphosphorylceramide transferase family protein n=1 Tax=Rhodopseudomonas boonkerdii TaxID=475937 RepID=UPI001E29AE7E|nr:hypothetical protein [Rhodopseudomonas boonkerdii]UGV25005.1 hypothetical protein E0H22_04525 [Rhodopseudomonas boonkerdii]
MIVELRCDPKRPRAWIAAAVRSLQAAGHTVQLRWVEAATTLPGYFDRLFALEKLVLQTGPACGTDLVDRNTVASSPPEPSIDIVVDFTDVPAREAATRSYLRPLFNGEAGELAAVTAILAGDMPVVELRDEVTGEIVDRGHPSTEVANGLSGALDSLMVRTVTLVIANLTGVPRPPLHMTPSSQRRDIGLAPRFVLCGLVKHFLRKVYRRVCYAPHWHIGWRFTDDDGVWRNHDLTGAPWHRLKERPHRFAADPFAVTWQGRTVVFFEELDHRVGKGAIAAIEFDDRGPVGEIFTVLDEPWHLSYPFLIEDGGELWMIPECSTTGEVILYRCKRFPDQWERRATLLSGIELSDATITRHDGRYYLFGVTREGSGGYSDTLSIYHADCLLGPWRPHAQNPVLLDRANARPAGNFVVRDGRLWRPVQDCSRGYGAAVALAEITELSPTRFAQIRRHHVTPSSHWPGRNLHTLNRLGRLEFIDGTRIQPKIFSYLFKL